ncbi:MAG: lysophospholipase [Deltaproteobacteria bacterium]|nr:lysophospholipase [Deltaproteobacteria bacterium]
MTEHSNQYFEGLFEGYQKTILPYRCWRPTFCEYVMVYVHGLGEHSGRYENLIKAFSEEEVGFYGYDQRGHGKTKGQRGYVPSMHHLVEDLRAFLRLVSIHEGSKPIYLLGHSFGGLVVLKYMTDLHRKSGTMPKGVIVCNPLLALKLKIPPWKTKLANLFSKILPRLALGGGIDPKWISHDPKVVEAYEKDPLICRKVTLHLYQEMMKTMASVKAGAEFLNAPLLIQLGTQDEIVEAEVSKHYYHQVSCEFKALKIYDGLYHELMNELGKEAVFNDMKRWILELEKIEVPQIHLKQHVV